MDSELKLLILRRLNYLVGVIDGLLVGQDGSWTCTVAEGAHKAAQDVVDALCPDIATPTYDPLSDNTSAS